MISNLLKISGTLVCAGTASLLSLKYFTAPYIWISIIYCVLFICGALTSKRAPVKLLFFCIGTAILFTGCFESYIWTSEMFSVTEKFEGDYADHAKGYFVRDEVLGYAPGKGKAYTAVKFLGGKKLYDVTYTIDQDGLRSVPRYISKGNSQCVLFFGGSFTFGEGLEDDETLPYKVALRTAGEYMVYNISFHGYGPHQMLAAIEQERLETTVECVPMYVIYQAIVSHVDRVAGLSFWDRHGPHYELLDDGSVVYRGHFDDDKRDGKIKRFIKNQMIKSLVYKKYIDVEESISTENVGLFVAVIDKTKQLLQARYPGLEFHVILWDRPEKNRELIIRLLLDKKVSLHSIEQILPHYAEDVYKYAIVPHDDNHPNALANDHIADYITTQILNR